MSEISNWKYEKWLKEMSGYNVVRDIRTYINLEIYPEDLEILITILMPKTFEIDELVFFDINGDGEQIVRSAYEVPDPLGRLGFERQKDWNSISVSDIFFNNRDNSSDETMQNIAKLIKNNWEYHLIKLYPNKKFIVEVYGEYFDPYITFYQI
ncbi:MAG: hypothetical protein Q4C98_11745 [Capnocytophaga sp.]|nr:hypothetical protein [Capnocytophaga sp.]